MDVVLNTNESSPISQAVNVSDHYPVEVELKSKTKDGPDSKTHIY